MTSAITIRGVTKTFGPKVAVKDLDLDIPAGSLTGFIGPNGAGKTTTIRMIMSIIFADKGDISVLGKASAVESKDRIGYLPEERGVYRKMKVQGFLAFMARLKGVDGPVVTKKVREWLARVGLPDVANKKCEELSKGMQQKVQFIAAVINEPDLLILDEVFSGLDPENRRLMRQLINEQHQGGRTILFSTHAMYEAEQLCDRILMIHNGRKALDLPIDELWARYDPRSVVIEPAQPQLSTDFSRYANIPGVRDAAPNARGLELRLADNASTDEVFAALAARGGLRRIELKRPNLEDIFIQIVGGGAELRAQLQADNAADAANQPALAASGSN